MLNLEAEPRATVSFRGTERAVVARAATAEEAERVFERAAALYPGYRAYRDRVGDRRWIRVFVLEPTG